MDTLGDRLRSAIEVWSIRRGHTIGARGAIRAFQVAMARRLRGSGARSGESYRAIMSYLSGSSYPALEWLLEAAELLGVRSGWLLTGEGYRTPEEELVGARITEAAQRALEALRAVVADGLGRDDINADTMRDLIELTRSYAARRVGRADDPAAVYSGVARAIVAPLAELGVSPAELPPDTFGHYLRVTAEILRVAVAEAGRPEQGAGDAREMSV